eukprot:scaffold141602_cov12-Prasinocladus_malaysianus.AAC.1
MSESLSRPLHNIFLIDVENKNKDMSEICWLPRDVVCQLTTEKGDGHPTRNDGLWFPLSQLRGYYYGLPACLPPEGCLFSVPRCSCPRGPSRLRRPGRYPSRRGRARRRRRRYWSSRSQSRSPSLRCDAMLVSAC